MWFIRNRYLCPTALKAEDHGEGHSGFSVLRVLSLCDPIVPLWLHYSMLDSPEGQTWPD